MTSTDAIATRFFCPPESWYGARSARSSMPSIASVSDDPPLDLVAFGIPMLRGRRRSRRARSGRTPARRSSGRRNRPASGSRALNCSSSRRSSVTAAPKAVYEPVSANNKPVEHLQQRRLAAAVGAEQRELLAARDAQRDAVERGESPEIGVATRRRRRATGQRARTRSTPSVAMTRGDARRRPTGRRSRARRSCSQRAIGPV